MARTLIDDEEEMDMPDAVNHARKTLAELETKRREIEARQIANTQEREEIAYEAMTGDPKARKRLDQLNREAAAVGLEMTNAESAIATARRRLSAADDAAARAVVRERAEAARPHVKRLREAGKRAKAALRALAEAVGEIESTMTELRGKVPQVPSHGLARVNVRRAISSELSLSRLEPMVLLPSQRVDFDTLIARYAEGIEQTIGRVIEENQEAA
jgi:hypothetical protein